MATWDDVLRIALTLPGAEESTSYEHPCVKVRKKAFANVSSHEEGVIVLRCADEEVQLLLAALPDVYYLTSHYEGWHCVLARLDAIDEDELAGRIGDAYAFVSERAKR